MLDLSTFYNVPELANECTNFLPKILTEENVFDLLNVSQKYSLTTLETHFVEFLGQNIIKVFTSSNFLKINAESLKIILKSDTLFVTEDGVFEAVLKWITCNNPSDSTKKEIADLVRLPLLSPEILAKVSTHPFFDPQAVIEAFSAKHNVRLPNSVKPSSWFVPRTGGKKRIPTQNIYNATLVDSTISPVFNDPHDGGSIFDPISNSIWSHYGMYTTKH